MSTTRKIQVSSGNKGERNSSSEADSVSGVKDIEDLKLEVDQAVQCDFDHLLRYFLYLVLDKDSSEKQTLDGLQERIEKLSEERYYPSASPGMENNQDAKINEAVDDDPERGIPGERVLVRKRDAILDKLLKDCLQKALEIANSKSVMICLKEFCNAEAGRQAPYVSLCNNALEVLSNGCSGLPVRQQPDELNIRFHHGDPTEPHIQGLREDLTRKPGVTTSTREANARFTQDNFPQSLEPEHVSDAPDDNFPCPRALSCTEFKVNGIEISSKAKKVARQRTPFTSTNRATNVEHSELLIHDPVTIVEDEDEDAESSKEAESSRVQCASYALEMLSNNVGVHHVINLFFIDEYLWISYYDRQGIVQSNGISFVADFPRFIVLLLAFQRFTIENWGIISCLNPTALRTHGLEEVPRPETASRKRKRSDDFKAKREHRKTPAAKINLSINHQVLDFHDEDNKGGLQRVVINVDEFLSRQPRCIAGRATAVLDAVGVTQGEDEVPMVCKIYHPEAKRNNEGETLEIVRNIAETMDRTMAKHLPTVYFYGDVFGFNTCRVRSMVRRCWRGNRVVRIICFKKLAKITSVCGITFMKAWLDVVTCHAFLWKNRVEHGDPALSNMMYDANNQCGVLTDFSSSILQWEDRVFGIDQTGTIPFMAVDLLCEKYWNGNLKRRYHHELEAFLWVLPYVFPLYQDQERQTNHIVDAWRTSDYNVCREKKCTFRSSAQDLIELGLEVQKGFAAFWPLVYRLCQGLMKCYIDNTVLLNPYKTYRRTDPSSGKEPMAPHILESDNLWNMVIHALRENIGDVAFLLSLRRLEDQKPDFSDLTPEAKKALQAQYQRKEQRL